MATNSVDLLSVIPGIQVSASDILQAELLLSQTLLAQDPTLDVRSGTAIRDLAIRPNATLLATINKALVYYWTQNSLVNVDDNTPSVFVDKILQNFFMTRFVGTKTVIAAKLYFAKQVSVSLTTDMFFSVDNTYKYFPLTSATYGAAQMVLDVSLNQYYLTVDLQAENTGTSYNISSGSLIYFTNFSAYFLHAEVGYLKSLSEDRETNTQFINRAQSTISTRNLINSPSIESNLRSNFSIVTGVVSVGMGDAKMVRDKVLVTPPSIGTPVWIHMGGATDIYVRVPAVTSLLQFTTDSIGRIPLTGAIYKSSISAIPGGPNTDTIGLTTNYQMVNSYLVTYSPTSVTRSGTQVTVTKTNHGLGVGERFTISGADQSQYNGTFLVVSVIDTNSFTYTIVGSPVTPATGATLSLTYVDRINEVGYSAKQTAYLDFAEATKTVTGVVWATGTVTVTCVAHGYTSGDAITLAGLSAYNGLWAVTVLTADTFSFSNATNSNPVTLTNATARKFHGNQSVSMNLYYHNNVDGIQTYLNDPANRVLSADQLSRGFNITELDISIVGYGATAPNQATASREVNSYLASLAPGQTFIMADLLSRLSVAGITTIQTPLAITTTKYWNDLLGPTYGTITDALNPHDITNVFILRSLTTSAAVI